MTVAVIQACLKLFAQFFFGGIRPRSNINEVKKQLRAVESPNEVLKQQRTVDGFGPRKCLRHGFNIGINSYHNLRRVEMMEIVGCEDANRLKNEICSLFTASFTLGQ